MTGKIDRAWPFGARRPSWGPGKRIWPDRSGPGRLRHEQAGRAGHRGLGRSIGLFAALLILSCAPSEDATTPPNLILISLDTCRADRLSCYGAERDNTPALDALADEAVRFTDCIASSSLTAPSHMSLFTGQSVQRHGVLTNRWGVTPPATLATLLRDAGWRTAAFTGGGSMQAIHGVDTGFDTFQSEVGERTWPFTRNIADVTPHALRWLDGVGRAPVFLFVHGYDPHCPYVPPEPYRSTYGGWYDGGQSFDAVCGPQAFSAEFEAGKVGDDELRWINDLYDAEIRAADEAIGAFLDALRERDLLERSIVVFLSDHGEILGRQRWVGHGMLWEEALRVPLLIRFPASLRRQVQERLIGAPVQLADVLPTVLEALGQPLPAGLQGTSLMPLVRDEVSPFDEHRLRVSRVGNQVSARFGDRWKIVFQEAVDAVDGRPVVAEDIAFSGIRELYDLQADPLEDKNLIQTPEGAAHFDQLANLYARWRFEAAKDDERYRGRDWRAVDRPEDERALKALGYTGEEEPTLPGEGGADEQDSVPR